MSYANSKKKKNEKPAIIKKIFSMDFILNDPNNDYFKQKKIPEELKFARTELLILLKDKNFRE